MPTIQPAPRACHGWQGGPPPKHQPRFSEADIEQARIWASSQTLPHAEVQRARLAPLLYEQPDLPSPEAARRLGQSRARVYKWRRRWAEQGLTLGDAPRPGRRPEFADWVLALVVAIACELPAQRGLHLNLSIVQRKVLSPTVARDLTALAARILGFEADYRNQARRFRWRFASADLDRVLCAAAPALGVAA